MSESRPGSMASRPSRIRPDFYQRPRVLLIADLSLIALFVVLLRWLVGGLLSADFLTNLGGVPPLIADAHLDGLHALLAFAPAMALVALTAIRLWLPGRLTWPWSPLIAAWVVIAFSETIIATPDVTAAAFGAGLIPAVLIGTHQRYLRRAAGQSPNNPPWTRLHRNLTLIGSFAVTIWVVVYLVAGVISIMHLFGPFPFEAFPHGP